MPYIEDENGNHIIDADGNKIEFTVTYENLPNGYEYKEPIHINNDGHLDTEDRHLVIKDGVNSNHALSVQQMINNNEDIIKPLINTNIRQAMLQLDDDVKGLLDSSIKKTLPKVDEKIDTAITLFANKLKEDASKPSEDDPMDAIMAAVHKRINTWLTNFKNELVSSVDEYLNNQVAMRIGRKSGTIPKTNYKWIKLLSKDDIEGINTLQEIIVTNTYIRRNDKYHHSKSDLVASSFDQLEFFFDVPFENYYCYFNNSPSDWTMEYFVEYIREQLPDNNDD